MMRSMLGLIAAGLLAGPMAGHAAVVSVQGGFTSFSGCVGYGGSIRQWLNGNEFVGTGAECDPLTKEANFQFATTSSVEFKNSSSGSSTAPIYNTPNVISFTPKQPTEASARNEPFLLGWLTFTNGVWTGDASFGFSITAYGGEQFGLQTFTDTLVYNLTPNLGRLESGYSPEANADYLTFLGNLQVGELRAYELGDTLKGNTVRAEVWGYFGSLHVDSFRNPEGGGFVLPGPTPAPEPSSLALLLAAGGALVWSRRRRRCDSARSTH